MRRFHRHQLAVAAGCLWLAAPLGADVYTVQNTDDAGTGSLRWAISQANGHAGPDSITFAIPGSGVQVIALDTPLPSLAEGTQILGDTQPGYAGAPLVRVDGQDLPANFWGFDTAGAGVEIRALQIVRFAGPGARVWHDNVSIRGSYVGTDGSIALANASSGIVCFSGTGLVIGGTGSGDGNVVSGNGGDGVSLNEGCVGGVVRGNRIGTDAAGSVAIPNQGNGVAIAGANHEVGGTLAGEANVLSGNVWNGALLWPNATGNQIRGNRIGTDAVGAAALGNGFSGIHVDGPGNTIGGATPGAGNLLSANGGAGLSLGAGASGTGVYGNRIGTDLAGGAPLGNGGGGVLIFGADNFVGGPGAGEGNLVSGNPFNGIAIQGASADGNQVVGNRIGTDAAGGSALGNEGYGIRALSGSGNLVAGNLISGNGRGFSLELGAAGYVVRGNVVGLDASMTAKLPNAGNGLDVSTPGHQIGGTAVGEGNVLAGNQYAGVWIDTAGATDNVFEGNWIGTNPAGTVELGNGQAGIIVTEASGNRIGGTAAGAGNVVAHNGYLGIYVWSGEGNAILGNSIHDNELLGIELEPQGPTANDAGDWDLGANRGQNFPVVTSAEDVGGDLQIAGFLDAHPLTEYRIELFSNPTFDPTGVGEGEHFLGATTAETDENGRATFATTLPGVGDLFVTATATAPSLDTSEFSPAIAVGSPQPGRLQIWRDLLLSYEGTPGLEVTVVRSHGVVGAVAVDVATVDGTASAPDDYGAVATTLVFAPGETTRSVFVPIVTDGLPEQDETWRLQLANPTGGASLGANDDVLAWLFDGSLDWPIYTFAAAAQVVEGDAGQRDLVFTVTLSPTNHDVPIDWWTSDGSAVAGEDYVESSGQLLFHPGETSKTISVPVSGDTAPEEDEVFYVHLYAQAQAIVWDGLGDGVIVDDDGGATAPLFLFGDDFEAGAPTGWASIVGMP